MSTTQYHKQQFAASLPAKKNILTPISPNKLPTTPPRNRKISESTGLVKFALSPPKQRQSPTRTVTKSPSKIGLAIDCVSQPPTTSDPQNTINQLHIQQRELLEKYSTKQAQVHEYEKQLILKKQELFEIAKKLEDVKRQEEILRGNTKDVYKQAYLKTDREIRLISNGSNEERREEVSPLKKQASFVMNKTINECNNVKKKASLLFSNQNEEFLNVKKKASLLFNNQGEDFQNLIKTSNQKFDVLTKQTSKFFNDLIFNEPKKKKSTDDEVADSTFNIENLNHVIYERSFENSSEVDIDDYDSSFEEK
ncbi:hypothetical protein G210_0889, partial [Candida maltosa Xu316]